MDEQQSPPEKWQEITEIDGAGIRQRWDDEAGRRFFSVIDVIRYLTDTPDPSDYWYKMKIREKKASGFEFSTICRKLKFVAADGKKYPTDCADVEGLLRIVQSIPSSRVEPMKLWLARVGYERIEEIKDPEKAVQRAISIYAKKGRPPEWISNRLRTIDTRNGLTDEWNERGVVGYGYAILTNEVYKGWSGMDCHQYQDFKGIARQDNLRDHMSSLELILTMLAEASTKEIAQSTDAQGFDENHKAAKIGSAIAGNARKEIEDKTKKPVITPDNFLSAPPEAKRLE